MSYPENDNEFQEHIVSKVDETYFTYDGVWSFRIDSTWPTKPTVGSRVRFYGRGIGCTVRGLYVDGTCAFYRSADEQRAHEIQEERARAIAKHEKWKNGGQAEYESRRDALPPAFRTRIHRFETNRPVFGIEFGGYELAACEEAVRIAKACPTGDDVRRFSALSFDEQKAMVPGMDEGHSGNTFGTAVRLAFHYVTNPENVWLDHAAIASLVGCVEAGCEPVDGIAEKAGLLHYFERFGKAKP